MRMIEQEYAAKAAVRAPDCAATMAQLLGSLAGSFPRPAPLLLRAVRLTPMRYFEGAGRVVAPEVARPTGRACQPHRFKLQAAGFVRPAPLRGCSEKSPRQWARAGTANPNEQR
jgi:hypothetical protein